MHAHDTRMTAQSTPQDCAQYLAPDHDPWTDPAGRDVPPGSHTIQKRGVVTIDMVGREDDDE
jgi:hypothetical protein